MPAKTLLKNGVDVPARSQRGHRKPFRIARDNTEGALTDRAGRSQDGDVFQGRKIDFGREGLRSG
jgi:hypothetical protein